MIKILILLSTFLTLARAEDLEKLEKSYNKLQEQCKNPFWKTSKKCRSSYLNKLLAQITELKNKSKKCKDDDYKTCYDGIEWGSELKKCRNSNIITLFDKNEMRSKYAQDDILLCDPFVTKQISKDLIHEYKWGVFNKCSAITIYEVLTGRYTHKYIKNSDEMFYLLSKYKKKYGKNPNKKSCRGFTTYHWENDTFDIILFTDQNNAIARYLHKGVFQTIIRELKKIDSKNKDIKSKKEMDDYKNLKDDI